MTIGNFDVVVIGSGAFGASVAFHLSAAGRNVALVDQAAIASQTSPRAAGLTGQVRRSEMMTHIASHSVKKIIEFTEETGEPLEYFQSGSLTLARTAEHAALIHGGVELGKYMGLDVDLVSAEEAAQLMPFLNPKDILAAGYVRSDVYLDPGQLPLGYARAAQKLGATLLPHTEIEQIIVERGQVTGVATSRGDLKAPVVVDAAGGWLRLVASFAGVALPAFPVRHQLMVTQPLAEVTSAQPTVRILDANIYIRPDRGGLMFGGYESDPVFYGANSMGKDFRIEDLELDIDVLKRLAKSVEAQFPVFRDAAIKEHRGGLPTMTTDGDHILGPVPGVAGLYAIGGCNVGGFSVSPALGELLAHWIIAGEPSMNLSRMLPSRFVEKLPESDMLEQCRSRYANYYSANPTENTTSAETLR
ncbi:FAD-binding oxidoreductase [Pseudomonas sp. 58 R 3]|uniref:NAD(P)/FAD-dependent oxidoreductase n=1 Tax=Pseudomonas sp. 58 R 3 TaxID=1844108 RepID=UPI000812416D|nr:FAD-binding oxidoreductase [Pseudomonas sp. 58 R 3]CRM49024.1 Sarcosine oxidase subunit beta [Pseudomonas sp. 58 R 3]